jgi:hypothetical protein
MAVSKQTRHKYHMDRFNLKKLNEAEGKEQYRVEISNRFSALETQTMMWMLKEPGKLLQYRHFSQRVSRLL